MILKSPRTSGGRLCTPSDPAGAPSAVVILGNPDSRRVEQFRAAARGHGLATEVISYPDYLAGRVCLHSFARPDAIVRIESPGESWETEKLILKQGIPLLEAAGRASMTAAQIDRKPAERGEIHGNLQWYLGFCFILARLEQNDSREAPIRWMSHPREIALAFDKLACYERWSAAGIPVPSFRGDIQSYEQLRAAFPGRHRRLFVKLRYGFSAIGAVALEWRDWRVRAITTVEATRLAGTVRLFVSKRARVLDQESDVAWLVDTLAREEILVEPWLPKVRIDGRTFDLRVVTIGGEASHVVGRASSSPFTNLNLDAARVPAEAVQERLGRAWPGMLALCRQAAAIFPRSLYTGLDLLILPDRERCILLEANAFGDYLPGLTHAGRSTYEAEVAAMLAPSGRSL